MIPADREAEILRLYHAERWKVGTIASQLGVHHYTVERVLRQSGLDIAKVLRPSMADAYVPFIIEKLEKFPKLCASRLFEMVKERGYPGGPDHFPGHRQPLPAKACSRGLHAAANASR